MTTRRLNAENAEIAEQRQWIPGGLLCALCGLCVCFFFIAAVKGQAAPIIVVETTKGAFAFETYPADAPVTVAHIIDLVKRGFYDGQRVHRAQPGFVVQWGDPRSRDLAREADWGRGDEASSGTPIGVAEMPKTRKHTAGAVAMAHMGNPARGDSQIFVTLADHPELNGKYTVFGHIVAGADVAARLERGDVITRMSLRE
jgi:cyclophilin family peptidyl-prolyl cis-trans isomerase